MADRWGRMLLATLLAGAAAACRALPEPGAGGGVGPLPPPPLLRIAVLEDARTLGGGELGRFLESPDPAVRARAALALGRIQDPAGVPDLLRALDDPAQGVRAEAIFALGQIPRPGSAAPLARILAADPDPELRALASEALGKMGDPSSWGALAQAAGGGAGGGRADPDPDAGVRGQIALAFWRSGIPHEPGIRDEGRRALVALARDPDPGVRWRAVYAVGRARIAHPDCLAMLRRALAAPSPWPAWERVFAARGLGDLGDPSDAAGLLSALEHSRPGEGGRGGRGGALVWPLRVEILSALEKLARRPGGIPDPRAAARAVAAACEGDPSPHVRAGAARIGPLLEGRGDAAPIGKLERIRALGSRDPEEALPRLRELFEKETDLRARTAAIEALAGFHGDEGARALVREALAEDDLALRGSAVLVLGGWKDPGFRDDLLDAYRGSARFELTEVRADAVDALAALGAGVPVAFFREALDDPEAMVRARAAAALRERTGEEIPFDRIHRTTPLPPERLAPIEAASPPRVRITTERGDLVIELLHRDAPVHCREFLERVEAGFYDGLTFHRVVPDFVIQGGDPRGDGWGGGERFVREQIHRGRFERGTVGMPTAGRDTGGVQLFITHCPTPHLDGRYTPFGRVVEGMDVVDRIERDDRIVRARREPSPIGRR